jgi:hypothetical protein
MFDVTKVLATLRLTPVVAAAILFFCAGGLFLPDAVLAALGVLGLRQSYRGWLGAGLLFSVALLLAHAVGPVTRWVSGRCKYGVMIREGKKYLLHLTPSEKAILRPFLSANTRTQTLSVQDGVLRGLEDAHIIFRATGILVGPRLHTDYNIDSWAWDHLRRRPELLRDAEDA